MYVEEVAIGLRSKTMEQVVASDILRQQILSKQVTFMWFVL
jgi:hypothetical protein